MPMELPKERLWHHILLWKTNWMVRFVTCTMIMKTILKQCMYGWQIDYLFIDWLLHRYLHNLACWPGFCESKQRTKTKSTASKQSWTKLWEEWGIRENKTFFPLLPPTSPHVTLLLQFPWKSLATQTMHSDAHMREGLRAMQMVSKILQLNSFLHHWVM